MEKQLIFRSIGPNVPVMTVLCGQLKDGQFVPEEMTKDVFEETFDLGDAHFIHFDDLFGGTPYVKRSDLFELFVSLFKYTDLIGFDFYDSFIVFKFNRNEITEEETKKE